MIFFTPSGRGANEENHLLPEIGGLVFKPINFLHNYYVLGKQTGIHINLYICNRY